MGYLHEKGEPRTRDVENVNSAARPVKAGLSLAKSNVQARKSAHPRTLLDTPRPFVLRPGWGAPANFPLTLKRLRRTLAIVLLALLTACAPRFAAERWVLGDRTSQSRDIPYGTDERQQLDVYRGHPPREPAPVIVFLYGGRWKYGSKDDYLLIGNSFARRGWITVIPNYRLYPETLFPGWVQDGATAVRWTVDNIASFGGDTSRIFVVGHSAGAHTAALLALDEQYLRDAGVARAAVKGYVSIAGPVDTTWTAPDVQRLMGPPAGWPDSYPWTHVGTDQPRLLLMHGDADDVVTVGNSLRLADRISGRDGCAPLRVYRGVGHVDIAIALGLPALVQAPVLADLAHFVRRAGTMECPRYD
jgi:acetyl esterase/lipase